MPPDPKPLTLARFRELIDAYGAMPARWPVAERAAAEALVRNDAQAARLLAEAEPLDALLDTYEVAELAPRVRARVLEVPQVAERKQRKRFGLRMAWAVALSCLIGVISGAWSAPEASADDDEWTELTQVSFYADIDPETGEEVP
ncbi:MAG TPA: hypothetical protein VJV78_10090 [Polyangiales bacterium]|nr:hypothetical protein [Polyangiales bacterium]